MKILGRTQLIIGFAIYRVDDQGHVDFVIIPACKIYGNNGLIISVPVCPSAGPILRSYEQDHDRIGAKV